MKDRCVNCGRFVLKGRDLCDDCMRTIAEKVEGVYKKNKPRMTREEKEKRNEAAYRNELERLFSLDEDREDELEDSEEIPIHVGIEEADDGVILKIHIPHQYEEIKIDLSYE